MDADTLRPGDLVGVNKDSYLVLDTLPAEYDSRVKAMEVSSGGLLAVGNVYGTWTVALKLLRLEAYMHALVPTCTGSCCGAKVELFGVPVFTASLTICCGSGTPAAACSSMLCQAYQNQRSLCAIKVTAAH